MLAEATWNEIEASSEQFIDNPYVSIWFWEYQRGKLTDTAWRALFEKSCRAAARARKQENAVVFLGILFDRLYVLRNQLMHGGATFGSVINRDQVRCGADILERLVPAMIHGVMHHPNEDWGDIVFPPAEDV